MRLSLRPSVHFRPYESLVNSSALLSYTVSAVRNRYEVSAGPDLPPLRLRLHGDRAALTLDEIGWGSVPYHMEKIRGYESVGSLWSPGYFRADLRADQRRHARRVDRAVGNDRGADAGGGGRGGGGTAPRPAPRRGGARRRAR